MTNKFLNNLNDINIIRAIHDDIQVAYIKFKEELAEMAAARR